MQQFQELEENLIFNRTRDLASKSLRIIVLYICCAYPLHAFLMEQIDCLQPKSLNAKQEMQNLQTFSKNLVQNMMAVLIIQQRVVLKVRTYIVYAGMGLLSCCIYCKYEALRKPGL